MHLYSKIIHYAKKYIDFSACLLKVQLMINYSDHNKTKKIKCCIKFTQITSTNNRPPPTHTHSETGIFYKLNILLNPKLNEFKISII